MSDRSLGYSVILFLIVFVVIPALYLSSKAFAPAHHRTIVFDSINTGSFLRIQDPVRLKGFEVGTVRSIIWNNGKTVVMIETDQHLLIHSDYSIIAEAKGYMGDRYLEIEPGHETAPLVDEKKQLLGVFPMGPTESIALMGKLGKTVDSIAKITSVLRNGSAGKPSFISSFRSVMSSLDSISASLSQVLTDADRIIGHGFDSLSRKLVKTDTLSRRLTAAVPETIASLESVLAKTEKLISAADTLIANADRLIKKVNGPEAAELAATFIKLKKQIETVRNLVVQLKEKGIALPVKL